MIPFNKPHATGKELDYIKRAMAEGQLAGDGAMTKLCNARLRDMTKCHAAMITHSCTAALEMAAILAGIEPGDEVIMPSYTFVSTANAFVLRGAVPVFVDIREDTLNMDEGKIEEAITPRAKAIAPVHYAGVGCEMDAIMEIAARRGLVVIEDAAQGAMSSYKGKPLGTFGQMGALSFHETKNIVSGEGGALLVNDPAFTERAEIIREKGTNRSKFLSGQVDKYTWVDIGSSYLPGEIVAAFLLAQLEEAERITHDRLAIWDTYHKAFEGGEKAGLFRRPVTPAHCAHNAHMYYLLLPDPAKRADFISHLKESGVMSVFHYVPLHSSPAGKKLGRAHGSMKNTIGLSERIVRLPLWVGMAPTEINRVVELAYQAAR
ncbi:MAG: dTDP-4-amino-4,6-dideoxygalactose transaminase [Nitrospinae bacterium]|nr:dTDP-4-amino-4,6-dideoxygalactose transaminase [Nitrospinota bacterium]